MRSGEPYPRIAWMPPCTRTGRALFPAAQELFAAHGFSYLEYCDIDQEPNEAQLSDLASYDVIYMTGGDPVAFRCNILRNTLSARLRQYLTAGRMIVAASGGSMQLTRNISLFRLSTAPFDEVLENHGEYEGLGFVEFEMLPHLNRFDPAFLEKVRRYSVCAGRDVLALADGAALLCTNSDEYTCLGRVVRYRNGAASEIGTIA